LRIGFEWWDKGNAIKGNSHRSGLLGLHVFICGQLLNRNEQNSLYPSRIISQFYPFLHRFGQTNGERCGEHYTYIHKDLKRQNESMVLLRTGKASLFTTTSEKFKGKLVFIDICQA
jgi:hypothetical protein